MSYRLLAFLEFDSQAQAQDAFNQLEARATNTRVRGLGTAKGRLSYARMEDQTGESPVLVDQFFVDTFGIVRVGEYTPPPNTYPLWIQPTGAQDSYPAVNAAGETTRVEHNGSVWENTHGDGNSWAPGVFGWTEIV